MEYNFKKVHTRKDLAISTIVLLAGAGLFFVNKGLGICIAVCGLSMYLVYKGGYKKDGKGILFTRKSEDICKSCRTSIVEFLEGKKATPAIKQGTEGGSIRLDVYYNKAEQVAYAQLFDFCNYSYESATGIVEVNGEKAAKLISLL
ncbi:MAG: hypothetical protein MJY89_05410 [Bacteroidales bacterium]|nr:hypothetical protein [Bacteroidales bacterium]